MIQILSINHAIKGGQTTVNEVDCNIIVSDSPLHAFNQVIHVKPDIIVVNMDTSTMDVNMLVGRLKKMQAAEGIPILLLAEYEDDVAQHLDARTFMMPDDEEDKVVLEWIVKRLDVKPKSKCKKIFVIDDDKAVLDTVELFLGGRYDVTAVSSVLNAFSLLDDEIPDLILLDIAMPEMDGRDAMRMIREDARLAEVPILFQTGMAGTNTVKECLKLGAAGFVLKPVQKSKLISKVDEVLGVAKGKRGKLLMIDEFDFHFPIVTNYLQDCYDVIKAPATLYAINVMEENKPDIVLLNADNAFYLMPKLREKATALKIPIVLNSSAEDGPFKAELKKPNTYFVASPLSREVLLDAFSKIGEWE